MECVIETKASMILRFIDGLRGDLHVTLEEGTWAAWLYDLLKLHVTKLVVCDPRKNASMKEGNLSDKIDARRLADLLRLICSFKTLTHLLQQTQLMVALGFRARMTHHAQRSGRNAPLRSLTLASGLRELDGAQSQPCLTARIVDDFTFIIEEHCRATVG